MGDEWTDCKLGDLGGFRNGVNFNSSQEGLGLPVIKVKDFGDLTISPDSGFDELNPNAIKIPPDQMVEVGDTLIIRSNGNPSLVGRSMLFRGGTKPTTFSGFCIRFRPDRSKVVPAFAAYFIRSPLCRQHFTAYGSGTGIQNLSQGVLTNLDICLPPLPEQQAIARVLGGLDDKIELNRQMNRTLEDLARGLFRSWFVDFDPVTKNGSAKALAAPIDLFPKRLVDSPLGPIPEGWRVGTFGREFKLTMGQSPPGSTYNEIGEGVPFYQGRTDFGFRFPKRRVYCTAPTRFAEPGDTLVSVRAPVGDLNMANEHCAAGRGIAAVRHSSGAVSYTYAILGSLREALDVFNGDGTLFGCIGKADFDKMQVLVPPTSLVEAFEQIAAPWDAQIIMNEKQTRALAATRDALLPQLLSGEIRLREAERAVDDSILPGRNLAAAAKGGA